MQPSDVRILSRRLGLGEDQLAREILQSQIVCTLFRSKLKERMALKGGLAMRAAYGSSRGTKDVDLQADATIPVSVLAGVVKQSYEAVLKSGLLERAELTMPKQTETVQRFKINGKLAGGETDVQLTVEVSRRDWAPEQMKRARYAILPGRYRQSLDEVQVYREEFIAAAKVDCLFNDNRDAPRDVYDLALLVTMRVSPPAHLLRPFIEKMTAEDQLKAAVERVWWRITSYDYRSARDKMAPFMTKEDLESFTPDSWEDMQLLVGEAVEGWLRKAANSDPEDPEIAGGMTFG